MNPKLVEEVISLLSVRKLWFPSPPAVVMKISTLLANDNTPL